ncbi:MULTISPECIES: ATP-dependent nuclease [Vibrio]|uniref:ATP-dependent nuclease n=1 Tax=Vibrio TaxID=662 RepID=UPI00142853D9|nr:AAA family ATPase [Vibrio diabolicus]QIR98782.1 AAA family ATPase [Vibrio diabolicus]
MKLSALLIENFKGIKSEVKILIDNVVILIGPNNCRKSTVLDAYEAYYSVGSPLSIDYFHNLNDTLPISITGVFTDISDADIDSVGQEWFIADDPEFGECAKFKFVWSRADEKAQKYSFSNKTNDFKAGGGGGWNTILSSRLPMPVRINPTDSTDALEQVVKELISKNAAVKIKQDKSKLANIMAEIDTLAKEVENELSGDISAISTSIQSEVSKMFTGMTVSFEAGVGKFDPEKAIKEGSRFIFENNGSSAPLSNQGSGVQRSFLWAAIQTLSSQGLLKRGRTAVDAGKPKVLLIDEPEINMHPAVIRSACEAIYALAELEGWQVICTTHSPVFIDLTKDHTTLIKVSNQSNDILYYQTDKSSFSDDEKENLKFLGRCCPTVNEFFFYDTSILVEGDTEYLAYQDQIKRHGLSMSHCVINCRGKANIPTFIKIFNQFCSRAIAIHDLDSRFNENGNKNAMWTINESIRNAADTANGRVITVVHNPDFEGYYLNESPKKDKPYNLFTHITSPYFDIDTRYDLLRLSLCSIEDGTHDGIYLSVKDLEAMVESDDEIEDYDDYFEEDPCPVCNGTGGDIEIECRNCSGTGYDPEDDKPFAQCHTCYGDGLEELDTCIHCGGSGVV